MIIAATLLLINGFVFRGRINTADALSFFMPTYCFMGRSLAAGHIPAWNPAIMGGVPFAADPQSGWMYLPAMALFSSLPCDVAIRFMLALQPILAGLGIYWFARSEGLARPAATVGGLVLSLAIAGSNLGLSLPFAGTLAWTALLLAAASRYLRATTWPGRLLWAFLTAAAWGQLAAAHFSVGMLMGTAALLAFVGARLWMMLREGSTGADALLPLAVLAVAIPAVNLAILLPKLSYEPRTDLSLGYAGLQRLGAQIVGKVSPPVRVGPARLAGWPMQLTSPGGPYLGAVPLALITAGWWHRRHRPVVVGIALFAAACYLLGLRDVASRTPAGIRGWRVVDFYLHSPSWFAYPVLLAFAILAAFGVAAWIEAPDRRTRLLAVIPGVAVFWILPPFMGVALHDLILLAAGAVIGSLSLGVAAGRPALAAVVPVVIAVELVVGGFSRGRQPPFSTGLGISNERGVSAAAYVRPGPIASAIRAGGGRYVRVGAIDPGDRGPEIANGLLPNHGMLFGIENVLGYDPVAPLRYWTFLRAIQGVQIKYNHSLLFRPVPPALLDLFEVRWIVAAGPAIEPGDQRVVAQGPWILYRRAHGPPRASLLPSWRVVGGTGAAFPNPALDAVIDPGFDPSREAVVETTPEVPPGGGGSSGTIAYRSLGPQSARIDVAALEPSLLVIRNAFDPNWHAEIDGHPTRLLRADYLFQAVSVPSGGHVVRVAYDDPAVGEGLAGSGTAVAVLAAAGLWLARKERRQARGTPASRPRQDADHPEPMPVASEPAG